VIQTPRWWRLCFWSVIFLLALDVAVFLWSWVPDLLGRPIGTEAEEWTELGVAIVSALAGLLLLGILLVLMAIRWIRESRMRSTSTAKS